MRTLSIGLRAALGESDRILGELTTRLDEHLDLIHLTLLCFDSLLWKFSPGCVWCAYRARQLS